MYKRNNKAHGQKVGGCHSLLGLPQQALQTGWLTQEKIYLSQRWRTEVSGQGASTSDSGEFSSPALQMAALLLCPHWWREKPSLLFFFFLIFLKIIYLFIYLWLCWVFVSVRGLSPVAASGGHSSSRCAGLSLSRPLLLRSTSSRCAGSVVVAHGPSCSAACGILPDQGWNPCPLHWQADSQPLRHQGSPSPLMRA